MSSVLPSDAPARRSTDPSLLQVSRAIGMARLICILGIVYVHAWTGVGGDVMATQAGSRQDMLRWSVVELFGRGAVPLLSVVSGWLMAGSLAKRGPGRFIAGKVRTVLLPMLLWNALAVLLVAGAGWWGVPDVPLPGGAAWFADNLLNLSRAGDINVQTAFLRDLFLCMLAAPLLVRLRTGGLALIGSATAIWAIAGWQLHLLLRPAILLFFILGILVRRHGLAVRFGDLPPRLVALPFLAILPFKIWLSIRLEANSGDPVMLVNGIDLLMRASAGLLVWRGAMALARSGAAGRLLAFERYAFVLFCSHSVFMWLIAPVIGSFSGPMGSAGWPLFFLLQPLLALGFAMAFARVVGSFAPKTAKLLSGGRLDEVQTTSPAAFPLAHAHWKL